MEAVQKAKPRYAVTHPGRSHTDDMLCGAILRLLYGDIQIYRREPTNEELKDRSIIVFDTGYVFNAYLNNFDHHQGRGLPASCMLIWDRLVSGKTKESKKIKNAIRETIIRPASDADKKHRDSLLADDFSIGRALSFFIKSFSNYDDAYHEGVLFLERVLRGKISTFVDFHQRDDDWAKLKAFGGNKIKLIDKKLDFIPPEWFDTGKEEGLQFFVLRENTRKKLPVLYSLNGKIPPDQRQVELADGGRIASYRSLVDAQNHALELSLLH